MRCTPTIHDLIVLTLPPRHRCPLDRMPASRLLLPLAGAQRLCALARLRHANRRGNCPLIGVDQKWLAGRQNGAIDPEEKSAPASATRSNAIFNASAWLKRPSTYPQTPRSEACLRRPRLAATSC